MKKNIKNRETYVYERDRSQRSEKTIKERNNVELEKNRKRVEILLTLLSYRLDTAYSGRRYFTRSVTVATKLQFTCKSEPSLQPAALPVH